MVKQLSPVIRADGYHILADLTGVPDLFAHIGPTLRQLLPGRNEPSALHGRARAIVTLWVLVVVPALRGHGDRGDPPAAAARRVGVGVRARAGARRSPPQAADADVIGVLTSVLQLVALALPVLGCVVRRACTSPAPRSAAARAWSAGSAAARRRRVARRHRGPRRARLGLVAGRPVPAGARRRGLDRRRASSRRPRPASRPPPRPTSRRSSRRAGTWRSR